MKKTYDSFAPCLELREVIFLRTLPTHAHLVPALDIFLDPYSRKLHICMEYMDGNLYQLMKARDHKCMDSKSVKSILYQILSGLDHIHTHQFFHRDIKPENILVSRSEEHTSELQSQSNLVCRLLLEKKTTSNSTPIPWAPAIAAWRRPNQLLTTVSMPRVTCRCAPSAIPPAPRLPSGFHRGATRTRP